MFERVNSFKVPPLQEDAATDKPNESRYVQFAKDRTDKGRKPKEDNEA
jgi:hypothetical protein